MGYQVEKIVVSVSLSRHNNERDTRDDVSWQELQRLITDLTEDPQFSEIGPQVN